MANDNPPSLNVEVIKQLADRTVFSRGQDIFRDGLLESLTRSGDFIQAEYEGSYGELYSLYARIVDGEITAANCSCPYAYGGICKHLVALLLTWSKKPEEFEVKGIGRSTHQASELLPQLLTKEKEELAALIIQLVQIEPHVEEIVGRLLQPELSKLDLDKVRKSLEKLFSDANQYEYDESHGRLDRELELQMRSADSLKENRPLDAGSLYAAIADAVVAEVECVISWDEEDFYGDSCMECIDGIFELLPMAEGETRVKWLKSVGEAYIFDLQQQGFGFSIQAVSQLQELRAEDWAVVEPIIDFELNRKLPKNQGRSEAMKVKETIVSLKARRLESLGDSEAAFELLMKWGTSEQKVSALMGKRDFAAATNLARESFGGGSLALKFADQLEAAGQWERAKAWAQEHKMRDWILEHSITNNDPEATEMNLQDFREHPNFHQWQRVLRSVPPEYAAAFRAEIWHELEHRRLYYIQYQVRMEEKNIDAAFELWSKLDDGERGAYRGEMAEATILKYPDLSVQLWIQIAKDHSEFRTREAYRQAAQSLLKAKTSLEIAGRVSEWEQHGQAFRKLHARLSALKEEMDKVGV